MTLVSPAAEEPLRHTPVGRRVPHGGTVPMLEPAPSGFSRRFADALGERHPVTVFLVAAVAGYFVVAGLTVGAGFLLTNVILSIDGVADVDGRFVAWLAGQRGPFLTELSLLGSIAAGGVVIPTVVGIAAATLVCLRRWRIAAFLVAAIGVEAATYRIATVFVHRPRPDVVRLEHLPVDASYPSGHTAAAIAVYCGLALVLTSRFRRPWVSPTCWSVALAIPPFVGMSRMYRGMHHPTDVIAGGLIGPAAILVALFAARAAGAAVGRRETR